ncbi:MAG: hypothetical protein OEZ39_00785 [Gammaproteobacteria bacterium]|nr:hypothetical protein [Gammaproteobacteria bacterium]MDH5650385.1 hypothetical protein [Gammaproteobacteria bacterium]
MLLTALFLPISETALVPSVNGAEQRTGMNLIYAYTAYKHADMKTVLTVAAMIFPILLVILAAARRNLQESLVMNLTEVMLGAGLLIIVVMVESENQPVSGYYLTVAALALFLVAAVINTIKIIKNLINSSKYLVM